MADEAETSAPDLDTEKGIQKFVEDVAEQMQQSMFQLHGIPRVGAVLAMRDEFGNEIGHAKPVIVGAPEKKLLRKKLRKAVIDLHGVGILLVHGEGRRVMFQLEHRKFGERVWYTFISDDYLFGKLHGPVTLSSIEADSLVMLPERYMN